jgi:hypothetical protein
MEETTNGKSTNGSSAHENGAAAKTSAPASATPSATEATAAEASSTEPDLAQENASLKKQIAGLQAEVMRLRNVATCLEITAKTIASMMPLPTVVAGG